MALTPLQRRICRLLAEQRRRGGESYVAGGAALNELLGGARLSRDMGLFHDTEEALAATWERDRAALAAAGLRVVVSHQGPAFVQARVDDGAEAEVLQWAQDSAFRFFPLVEDPTFGLTLHPFDHATNKVLALAGRRKVRGWVDAIRCHEAVQPLGYVAWAASGKDPGLSPAFILEQAARTRYVQEEIDQLAFEGPAPRAADLSVRWHRALDEARQIVRLLPPEQAGRCVLDGRGGLARSPPDALARGGGRGSPRLPRGTDPRRLPGAPGVGGGVRRNRSRDDSRAGAAPGVARTYPAARSSSATGTRSAAAARASVARLGRWRPASSRA